MPARILGRPVITMAGGKAGTLGRHYVIRANGDMEVRPHVAKARTQAGDCFVIEMPGGGGFEKDLTARKPSGRGLNTLEEV